MINTKKVPAKIDFPHYDQVTEWGDPDIDQAAQFMQFLYSNRLEGVRLGKKARESVMKHFSQAQFKHELYNIICGISIDNPAPQSLSLTNKYLLYHILFKIKNKIFNKSMAIARKIVRFLR